MIDHDYLQVDLSNNMYSANKQRNLSSGRSPMKSDKHNTYNL